MIQGLLDKHKVPYRVRGNDLIVKCFNPDHDDSSPSLGIDKRTGLFHCFSCGFAGNLLKLLKILGEPEPSQNLKLQVKIAMMKDKLERSTDVTVELPNDRQAVTGGFRDLSKSTLVEHMAFITNSVPELQSRLCIPIYYRNRLMFIEARALHNENPKYIRYPEGASTNFILSENCGAPLLVITEGIMDYLRLRDLGITNVTPLFGLSFTKEKASLIKDSGFVGIINLVDNDEAGNKVSKSIEKVASATGLIYKRFTPVTDAGDLNAISFKTLVKQQRFKLEGGYLL